MWQQPVLLTGRNLIAPAIKWTLPYLEQHMGSNKHTVYISKDNRKFKFYNEKKVIPDSGFREPMRKREWTFSKFADELRKRIAKNDNEAIYYQDALTDAVGEPIKHDFVHFNWQWLNERKKRYNWGQLTSNLLLIAFEGVCHSPQVRDTGLKGLACSFRFMVGVRVDFDEPDLERFPNFQDCEGYECTVRAGEVLYIPMYWWHYFESIPKGQETISVTFWYKSGPLPNTIEYPLNGQQKTAIMRNIEKMLIEALKDPKEFETSGPLLATVHFSDVGHLDLTNLAWPLQEGAINTNFKTSGPLLATVHFGDVGHLDLTYLAWPLQEGARDTNLIQPTKKQCTPFDVRLKTVPKETISIASRVDRARDHIDPAVVQQQEQRRQARQDRELRAGEPANIPVMVRIYPGWLNIPMKTFNGQPARGVLGPWGTVNDTTEHLKLNFDAFAKLSPGDCWWRMVASSRAAETRIRSLIRRLNMRVWVATKEAQKLPKGWEVMVRLWLLQFTHTIYSNNILRLLGIDDKRQILLTCCILSDNNWSNLETFKLLFDIGHLPYLLEAKKKLNLPEDYPDLYAAIHHPPLTMLILHHISFCSNLSIATVYLFDVWSVQFSEAFLTHLKDKAPWLIVKFILDFWPIVPGALVKWSLTAKTLLKNFGARRVLFDTGFGFLVQIDLVSRAFTSMPRLIIALHMNMIKDGVPPDDQTVDLRISVLNPLLSMFLAHAFKRISEDKILVKNTWKKVGILQCFNTDFQREAVRLAFAGQLYPADEQPLVADNGPGAYDTLENDDDDAAEKLQQWLQQLNSFPEGPHAETLQPDWAQDVGRAAAKPAGKPG
eukprot:Em0010g651a